jgi:hypothetical protein
MEEEYTKTPRVNRKRNAYKKHAKNKRLQKEQQRTSRPSSCRLGKNQKKLIARTNIILDEQNQITDQEATAQISSRPIILRRQRRKQSHRPVEKTRISETSYLHDLEEYDPKYPYYIPDDGYEWARIMAEVSEEAHRECREQRRRGTAERERREREQNEKEIELLYERILQETKRNFAIASRAGIFRDELHAPYTMGETRCCTGNCIIYTCEY